MPNDRRDVPPGTGPSEVTDDAFLGGALQLLQPKSGYRAGVDAVLLAAAVPVDPAREESVLDVGAGVGTAGLCVARRCETPEVVLLERVPELAALAHQNVLRNGLEERARAVAGDIAISQGALASLGLPPESFDHVIANPPFHALGRGTPAPHPLKTGAHAMAEQDLEQWARFMARMAAPGGRATLIHKAEALGAILAAFTNRFGDVHVLPILPVRGSQAIRVLVQGIKASRAPLVLLDPLVLHENDRRFTPAVEAMLREGAPLPLQPGC